MNKINLSLTGRECNDVSTLSSSIVSVTGQEWRAASPISASIVSVTCFAWFVIELDDLFPLAACVVMACKAIYDLSKISAGD